ncbi:hypothetical protein ANCDUO_25089, partial [Ancylostoma duodenale]
RKTVMCLCVTSVATVEFMIGATINRVLVIEDNCCFCNTAAFTLSNEQKNIDLFFVSFRNELYE